MKLISATTRREIYGNTTNPIRISECTAIGDKIYSRMGEIILKNKFHIRPPLIYMIDSAFFSLGEPINDFVSHGKLGNHEVIVKKGISEEECAHTVIVFSLGHPNIARMCSCIYMNKPGIIVGVHEKQLYLFLEKINGNTIDYLYDVPLSGANVMKIVCELADLFYFLSKYRVSHGDLFAGNIMVQEDMRPVLIDFDTLAINDARSMDNDIAFYLNTIVKLVHNRSAQYPHEYDNLRELKEYEVSSWEEIIEVLGKYSAGKLNEFIVRDNMRVLPISKIMMSHACEMTPYGVFMLDLLIKRDNNIYTFYRELE